MFLYPTHNPPGSPSKEDGWTNRLRGLPAHHVKAWYQKILGEEPEAVKPCLEGSM